MESTNSLAPRRIADSFDAVCNKCGSVAYREQIIGELQDDGSYAYHRRVTGGFIQQCDSEGTPTGPVVPKCNCQEN